MENSRSMCLETPSLPVVKNMFPFRLAATSYIIPATIPHNLRFLGSHVDEVELVLFESRGGSNLPSRAEILEIMRLGKAFDITFNVHLPTDIFLGDADPHVRQESQHTVFRFYERTLPLNPEVYVLHLDSKNADGRKNSNWNAWLDRMSESVARLLDGGMNPRRLAVENLEYPMEIVLPIIDSFGMGVCLDIGHMLRYGYHLARQLDHLLEESIMVHLHGVKDGVDHLGVEWIPEEQWRLICRALKSYRRGVSLEVFSLDHLISSLERIRQSWMV
jgi:sugar phosphate isomerase/epimerase